MGSCCEAQGGRAPVGVGDWFYGRLNGKIDYITRASAKFERILGADF